MCAPRRLILGSLLSLAVGDEAGLEVREGEADGMEPELMEEDPGGAVPEAVCVPVPEAVCEGLSAPVAGLWRWGAPRRARLVALR